MPRESLPSTKRKQSNGLLAHARTDKQTSAKAYPADSDGSKYDRGHMVPANHLDYSTAAAKSSNAMSNILPQHYGLNRGAWLLTEEIVECHRDVEPLSVVGGAIYHNLDGYDNFAHFDNALESHGVRTPAFYWKVIRGSSGGLIAWILPNRDVKRADLDEWIVSVADIEAATGVHFPGLNEEEKSRSPAASWALPSGCDKS